MRKENFVISEDFVVFSVFIADSLVSAVDEITVGSSAAVLSVVVGGVVRVVVGVVIAVVVEGIVVVGAVVGSAGVAVGVTHGSFSVIHFGVSPNSQHTGLVLGQALFPHIVVVRSQSLLLAVQRTSFPAPQQYKSS